MSNTSLGAFSYRYNRSAVGLLTGCVRFHLYYVSWWPHRSIGLAPVYRCDRASRINLRRSGRVRQHAESRETLMNVAKWLLFTVLALPFLELVMFVVVASHIGFAWALLLVLASSLAGLLVLRHAGGNHIARIRGAMGEGSFTSLQADGSGGLILLAGIL